MKRREFITLLGGAVAHGRSWRARRRKWRALVCSWTLQKTIQQPRVGLKHSKHNSAWQDGARAAI